jgi:hypothetical protein
MKFLERLLRRPEFNRALERFGINPKHYWILMDLFAALSERREMLSQLGRSGTTLKYVSILYFLMMGFFSLMFALSKPSAMFFFASFQFFGALMLLMVLMAETGTSLVNPVEGLVLAHQPINGATYTAAKLSHVLRIVLYLVPGLGAGPALAGLALQGTGWTFPLVYLGVALLAGLALALACCALFGWLIRIAPPARVKSVAHFADVIPGVVFLGLQFGRGALEKLHLEKRLNLSPEEWWWIGGALAVVALASVFFGIRALSGDYLSRVATMVQGGSRAKGVPRRSRFSNFTARFFGGQGARAGYGYVTALMPRDWQFRRQLISMAPMIIGPVILVGSGLRKPPFADAFTPMQALPHVFGALLFFVCSAIPYGAHHKGVWMFLLAPSQALGRFARGVFATLWLWCIALPHVALFPLLAWYWGLWRAALFLAFSVAVSTGYLGLEMRVIKYVPFSRQMDAARSSGMMVLPLMVASGFVIAILVALQHFVVFRSPWTALAGTAAAAFAAWHLTRSSLTAFTESMRFNLGLISNESGSIYKEVDA